MPGGNTGTSPLPAGPNDPARAHVPPRAAPPSTNPRWLRPASSPRHRSAYRLRPARGSAARDKTCGRDSLRRRRTRKRLRDPAPQIGSKWCADCPFPGDESQVRVLLPFPQRPLDLDSGRSFFHLRSHGLEGEAQLGRSTLRARPSPPHFHILRRDSLGDHRSGARHHPLPGNQRRRGRQHVLHLSPIADLRQTRPRTGGQHVARAQVRMLDQVEAALPQPLRACAMSTPGRNTTT